MLKKIIAALAIFCMLIPLSSVVAADNPSAKPTVEEILDEYHRKSMEAQDASAYSRSASDPEPSLEQQTVDQLTNAGYEAYNVTAENYDAVQDSLQTDLSALGLDPNSSYIVVISADPAGNNNNGNKSRLTDLLLPPHVWEGGGGGGGDGNQSSQLYTYNGRDYRIRYVTVTKTDHAGYGQSDTFEVADLDKGFSFVDTLQCTLENLLNNTIYATLDHTSIPLGTIASICGVKFFDFGRTDHTAFETLLFRGCSSWIRTFTEVYVESESQWKPYLYVESVTMYSYFIGDYYDATLQRYTQIERNETYCTKYSPNYNNTTFRIEKAIEKYLQGEPGSFYYDKTGDVHYLIGNQVVITHDDSVPY